MREIKFRVWDKYGNKMCDVTTVHLRDGFDAVHAITINGETLMRLENIAFMQFTGLKDMTGKEIYEGDIIHGPVITDTPYAAECPSLQCFHWYQELEDALEEGKQIKVIGNIYENPELLAL